MPTEAKVVTNPLFQKGAVSQGAKATTRTNMKALNRTRSNSQFMANRVNELTGLDETQSPKSSSSEESSNDVMRVRSPPRSHISLPALALGLINSGSSDMGDGTPDSPRKSGRKLTRDSKDMDQIVGNKKIDQLKEKDSSKRASISDLREQEEKAKKKVEKEKKKEEEKEKKQEEKEKKHEEKEKKKLEKERKKKEEKEEKEKISKSPFRRAAIARSETAISPPSPRSHIGHSPSLDSSIAISYHDGSDDSYFEVERNDRRESNADTLLTTLPMTVLKRIFNLLPIEAIVLFSETCKYWQIAIEEMPVWNTFTLKQWLDKQYQAEQLLLISLPTTPEYETERTLSLLRSLSYLKKLRRREMYLAKVMTLVELHISLGNWVEAGLSILLQADEYDWLDRPNNIPGKSIANTKDGPIHVREKLYHTAIKYFGEGKYWELGIGLIRELRELNQNFLRTALENTQLERECYQNIKSKDRFFEQYFFVEFYGDSIPIEYKDKKFVYRGVEIEKLGNFLTRLKARFPEAEILHADPTDEQLQKKRGQFIRVRTCKPSSIQESQGGTRPTYANLPSPIRIFKLNTTVNCFSFSSTFKKNPTSNIPNDPKNIWIRNTYIVTKETFPTIQRASLIIDRIERELSPIMTSVKILQDKNDELEHVVERTEIAGQMKSTFTMALKGVIDAAVNGGTKLYKDAFFTDEFAATATAEDLQYIENLKTALLQQNDILEKGLKVHDRLKPENMANLHESMVVQYAALKEDTLKFVHKATRSSSDATSISSSSSSPMDDNAVNGPTDRRFSLSSS